ncbi:MAG: SHOCT domain-containing protein [Pseudomonadota bacterium]
MSVAAELSKLEAMHKDGTITDEEFVLAKRKVLQGLPGVKDPQNPFSSWRFITLAVIAVGALGILAWWQLGIEPEPDPALTMTAIAVVFFAILFARPLAWFGWGWGWGPSLGGGADDELIPLAAVIAVGAVALAGGAFLIGLPLIALGLGAIAVIGAVMWCWDQLFGD